MFYQIKEMIKVSISDNFVTQFGLFTVFQDLIPIFQAEERKQY